MLQELQSGYKCRLAYLPVSVSVLALSGSAGWHVTLTLFLAHAVLEQLHAE